jgi:hypothetical protein
MASNRNFAIRGRAFGYFYRAPPGAEWNAGLRTGPRPSLGSFRPFGPAGLSGISLDPINDFGYIQPRASRPFKPLKAADDSPRALPFAMTFQAFRAARSPAAFLPCVFTVVNESQE